MRFHEDIRKGTWLHGSQMAPELLGPSIFSKKDISQVPRTHSLKWPIDN